MTLLAAFQTLLHRYSGAEDLTTGMPVAGRNQVETEGLIGFFVNTLVLRVDLSGRPSFTALLRQVREKVFAGHTHQDVPFEKLVEELRPQRSLSHSPFFQVVFAPAVNLLQTVTDVVELEMSWLGMPNKTAKVALALEVAPGPKQIAGSFSYTTDLFDRATVARLADHLENLLVGVAADPEQRLSQMPLLSTGQSHFEVDDNLRLVP